MSDGSCNVLEKARGKAVGIDRSDLEVSVAYDAGDRTPVVITSSGQIENVIKPGQRIIVEAKYKYKFLLPFLQAFAPELAYRCGVPLRLRAGRKRPARLFTQYVKANCISGTVSHLSRVEIR